MNWRSVQSWMVVGLLFCLVLVQGMQAVRDFQADTRCKTVVENYQSVIDAQKITYQDLLKSYEKAAYQNSSVERIAEQQLLASESQLTALQVIASQNGILIEIASLCK